MQSKLGSFIEANVSTFVGFALSVLVWEFVVKPVWGLQTTVGENLQITSLFTVVSIARGYVIRRWFNRRMRR